MQTSRCSCQGSASTSGRGQTSGAARAVPPPRARATRTASLARPHVNAASVALGVGTRPSSVPSVLSSLRRDVADLLTFSSGPRARHSVLGWGQGIVDMTVDVSFDDIKALGAEGGRRIMNVDERAEAIRYLSDRDSLVSAGGSVANSLVGFSRIAAAMGADVLPPCMTGYVGADPLGQYFTSQLEQAGVAVLPDGPDGKPQGYTGTVMVLTTPDAQRSFLVMPPSGRLTVPAQLRRAIGQSQVLLIEGYLWEAPGALAAIMEAVGVAVASGCKVAMTAGDPSVVRRHRESMLKVLSTGKVDMVFSNHEEARLLLGPDGCSSVDAAVARGGSSTAAELARALGDFAPMAVVTDGANGSCVSAMGQVHRQPAALARNGVVDTCGAGDAFAAGVLFGLCAFDFSPRFAADAGSVGAMAAATVIGHHGAELSELDADELAAGLPRNFLPPVLAAGGRRVPSWL